MTTTQNTLADCHVCPWWMAYTFDNPIRRFFHKPEQMFAAYLQEGMTAMDIGCGMGYFSIGMAHIVGEQGTILSVDLQQKMLDVLYKRAQQKGVAGQIAPYRCQPNQIGPHRNVDFALTFWMAHEVPDIASLMQQIHDALKTGGKYLLVEPKMHVTDADYDRTVSFVRQAGFTAAEHPAIRLSRATLFEKQ